MPPSRFGASKFRNAVPVVPSREAWYRTHLPQASSSNTTSSSTSTLSSEVKSTRRWIITVSASGEVSWRGYRSTSESGDHGGIGSMKVGGVGDWDVSRLEDETLVVGGTDGTITVYRLPSTETDRPRVLHTFSVGSAITSVALHPTTPSILLVAATQFPLAIYDLSTTPSEPSIVLKVQEPKGLWSCGWSPDGKRVAAIGRSGKCYIFDPRQSTEPTISKSLTSIQPLRPARVVWVGDQLFLTGTDRSRNRLYSLLQSTDLSPVFTQNVDTNLSPLITTIDQERKIIYVSGRGDMSIRQVELGGVTGFQETIHPLPFPMASTSLSIVHPTALDVMSAEIGRLLVSVVDKDGDAILPLGIKVPRRQLIDYHDDLYPEITGTIPEQSAKQWLEGGDAMPMLFSLDPSRRHTWEAKLSAFAASGSPDSTSASAASSASTRGETSVDSSSDKKATTSTPPAAAPEASVPKAQEVAAPAKTNSNDRDEPKTAITKIDDVPKPLDQPTASTSNNPVEKSTEFNKPEVSQETRKDRPVEPTTTTPATITPAPASSPRSEATDRYNPGWSRKFLSGKTPLNPTYDSLPPLSSLHQDSLIFKISPGLAFFPVQGPGGRLGVHPLKKKGRMMNGGEGYLSAGIEIADFDVEPFSSAKGVRVAIGGEDGIIRIWTVGSVGTKGVGPEAEQVLKGDGVDKIATVAFHPTVKDLLTVLTNDGGSCSIRLFDLGSGGETKKIPLDLDGAFNMIWSPSGDRVALSTKDSRIVVLDPRLPESATSGPAHDSPRSSQLTWIDSTHVISVGFSKGSQRRINLYSLSSGTGIETISSTLIDVSPSVLFPVYDHDTSILYVWGKGERQIQAFEVHPEHKNEPISKLPSFTSGSGSPQLGVAFFPKRMVDVKKVEVGRALRLTSKSIEEVSFCIPRNKPDFFQDDIYVDTLDVETPATTFKEWVAVDAGLKHGAQDQGRYISLKPEGMTLLSKAPKTNTEAKKKFVPAANVMSEQEKKKQEMDNLFRKAKMDESSDEDDEPKRTGLDPPDDDW